MQKTVAVLLALMSLTTGSVAAELPSKKSLNLAAVKTMVAAAEAEAEKRNVQVTICIEDENGKEEIAVGKQPRIRLNEEEWILLRHLQPNDRIEIRPPSTADRPYQIAVLRPVQGRGELKEVDPEGSMANPPL